MSISYEGIGAWCATFACEGVEEGAIVKIADNGTAAACAAGEDFIGVAAAVGRDGKACSVQLGGLVRVKYSGETAPSLGYCTIAADGAGGIMVPESGGRSHLIVEKDTAGASVTMML